MAITIEFPPGVEERLRVEEPKLEETAKEQLLIALYNAGKVSVGEIANALGHESRFATERWLFERKVQLNYTLKELEADDEVIEKLFGSKGAR